MKIKEKFRSIHFSTAPRSYGPKRGIVRLELKDESTGEVKVLEDHNMVTNGIAQMLANCGWLNQDNIDHNNLVEQLLGGVMLFSDEITEDANITVPPADLTMIANAAIGTTNSDNTELGSYRSDETGWIDDDTYQAVFEWATGQGNCPSGMSIASLCATGKTMGYVGYGNEISGIVHSTQNLALVGSSSDYYVTGIPARISLADSDCYTVTFDGDDKATIRHYMIPLGKVNLAGRSGKPWLLGSVQIDIPSGLASFAGTSSNTWNDLFMRGFIQGVDGHLMILNRSSMYNEWGNQHTQYLWDIDIVNATVTEEVLLNTSGVTLHSIDFPVWLNKDTLAWVDGGYDYYHYTDGRTIYSMRRTNGVWSTIQSCTNPLGSLQNNYGDNAGWKGRAFTSPDRAFVKSNSNLVTFDFVANKCNATNGFPSYVDDSDKVIDAPMVRYVISAESADSTKLNIYRSEEAIATIFNLSAPVVKTSAQSMKLIYTFEFGEEEP